MLFASLSMICCLFFSQELFATEVSKANKSSHLFSVSDAQQAIATDPNNIVLNDLHTISPAAAAAKKH